VPARRTTLYDIAEMQDSVPAVEDTLWA